MDFASACRLIRANEIGKRARIATPFGKRLLEYADLTATGRYLRGVEALLQRVKPYYANTHTEVSSTGRAMTRLREQSRRIIHRAVNASPSDEVVFVGSGATAAVNKLIGLLGWKVSEPLDRAYKLGAMIPRQQRPVVFIGPYEHHSNELSWLESIAEVHEVDLDEKGSLDLKDLEALLEKYADRPIKLGSFSAGSNVTGALTDVPAVARLLRKHKAIVCFDYAATAPYVPIDMHPADPNEAIDAIVLSSHKFIGGPNGSGILVAHRSLFQSRTPERPGGGTVDYVSGSGAESVDYCENLAVREEGGTPAIISDIRAGVAFLAKDLVGASAIIAHERALARQVLKRLGKHPKIQLLGPCEVDRLAIFSFNIERIHHDFVSGLLDHLFGIQNRSGCSCAGPYGHRLLGIDDHRSEAYRHQIRSGLKGLKPGWVRVSIPYYATEEDVEFIVRAVEFIADHGRDFLPAYRLNWYDGGWEHVAHGTIGNNPISLTLEEVRAAMLGKLAPIEEAVMTEAEIIAERASYFEAAEAHRAEIVEGAAKTPSRWNPGTGRPEIDALVWFDYLHTEPASLPALEGVTPPAFPLG